MAEQSRKYSGIDFAKFVFACAIPLFHIGVLDPVGNLVGQYFSRLGVPFFFGVSGFFLARKIYSANEQITSICASYFIRIGKLFLVWELIYSPVQIYSRVSKFGLTDGLLSWVHSVIMSCPSYLWYLVATLVGVFFLMLSWQKTIAGPLACVLFVIGTLLNSYSFLLPQSEVLDCYYQVFLTSRNGLFFAYPCLLVGAKCFEWSSREKTMRRVSRFRSAVLLVVAYLIFCVEVTIVRSNAANLSDTSMYFSLPLVLACLVFFLIEWNDVFAWISGAQAKFFRFASTVIYVSQQGFLLLFTILSSLLFGSVLYWPVWVAVVACAVLFSCVCFRNSRLHKLF